MSAWKYFASGSNHPGEILGFDDCGLDVGVAVHELRTDELGLSAVEAIGRTRSSRLFVDSGAFSEVDENFSHMCTKRRKKCRAGTCIGEGNYPYPDKEKDRLVVIAPITNSEWERRLDIYDQITDAIGGRAYLTAPDKVSYQNETLLRLSDYRDRMLSMHERGANIIVPYQKGWRSFVHIHDICTIMMPIDYIVGIPMKKDATSLEEILVLLRHRPIKRIHLLGKGPRADDFDEVVSSILSVSPDTEISCDSVLIRSLTGRSNGPGDGPRILTLGNDKMEDIVVDQSFNNFEGLDWTDEFCEPSAWLRGSNLDQFLQGYPLDERERRRAKKDIDSWLDEQGPSDWLDFELQRAWVRWLVSKASVTWRKRETIKFAHAAGML